MSKIIYNSSKNHREKIIKSKVNIFFTFTERNKKLIKKNNKLPTVMIYLINLN